MTCVVGYEFDGRLFLGGDSYISNGSDGYSICPTPKVYKIGTLGVGICGSVRVEQILESSLKKHIGKKKGKISEEYFVNTLIPKIKKDMQEENCLIVKDDDDGMKMKGNSSFLFGIDKKLYSMGVDFSLWRSESPYAAIGTGAVYALGAFEILKDLKISPEEKIHAALKASAKLCSYVRAPYTLVEVK
jgi:ATP-dependent protease HslVU (ClpYQ) peptidase subunit